MILNVLAFGLSFIITFMFLPYFIKRLSDSENTIIDMYKFDKPKIPTHGGVVVLFIVIFVCSILPLIGKLLGRLSINYVELEILDVSILFVITIFGLFGVFDDLVNLPWLPKIFIPVCFSFPLLLFFNPETLVIPHIINIELSHEFISGFDYSDIFKFLIIPVYIMVVSNLVNMHSGFNGLQTGLSTIVLITIMIKIYIDDDVTNIIVPATFLGGMLALWFYNKYPSRIFEGNIGPLAFGAVIGTFIVIKELYFFGIIILFPHIIDFLMLCYIRLKGYTFVKFGKLNSDGTIDAPNPIKVKFLLPYYYKLTEPQVVNICYLITIFFCILGLLLT